jgi:hypothetical protein
LLCGEEIKLGGVLVMPLMSRADTRRWTSIEE